MIIQETVMQNASGNDNKDSLSEITHPHTLYSALNCVHVML